jgi:hypothetical protein
MTGQQMRFLKVMTTTAITRCEAGIAYIKVRVIRAE